MQSSIEALVTLSELRVVVDALVECTSSSRRETRLSRSRISELAFRTSVAKSSIEGSDSAPCGSSDAMAISRPISLENDIFLIVLGGMYILDWILSVDG